MRVERVCDRDGRRCSQVPLVMSELARGRKQQEGAGRSLPHEGRKQEQVCLGFSSWNVEPKKQKGRGGGGREKRKGEQFPLSLGRKIPELRVDRGIKTKERHESLCRSKTWAISTSNNYIEKQHMFI